MSPRGPAGPTEPAWKAVLQTLIPVALEAGSNVAVASHKEPAAVLLGMSKDHVVGDPVLVSRAKSEPEAGTHVTLEGAGVLVLRV